jgi:hypothetical protein
VRGYRRRCDGTGHELDGWSRRPSNPGIKLYVQDLVDEFCDDYVLPKLNGRRMRKKYLPAPRFADRLSQGHCGNRKKREDGRHRARCIGRATKGPLRDDNQHFAPI